jgi:hypothetical protein
MAKDLFALNNGNSYTKFEKNKKDKSKIVESTFWSDRDLSANKSFFSDSIISCDGSLASPTPNFTHWGDKEIGYYNQAKSYQIGKHRNTPTKIAPNHSLNVSSVPDPTYTKNKRANTVSENNQSDILIKKRVLENLYKFHRKRTLGIIGGSWFVVSLTLFLVSVIGYASPVQTTGYKCYTDVTTKATVATTTTKTTTTTTTIATTTTIVPTTTTTVATTTTTALNCSLLLYQYFDSTTYTCIPQLLHLKNCTSTSQCRNDLGLTCVNSVCVCNSTSQFWDGSSCTEYYTYNNQTCSNDNQCIGSLVCQLSSISCVCPANVVTGKCDCPIRVVGNETYWNGTDCVPALSYGTPCSGSSFNYTCQTLTDNAYCIGGVCKCDSDYAFILGRCRTCKSGWVLFNDTCNKMSVQSLSSNGLATSSEIQTACDNEPTAKLALLNNKLVIDYWINFIPSKDTYFVDGFRVSGTDDFISADGSWSVNASMWCSKNPAVTEDCLFFIKDNGPDGFCFMSADCGRSRYALCQATPY